jgi:hypothetical protein
VLYLILKAALSGVIIAVVSEVAKRSLGFGGPDRLLAAGLGAGDDLAVARHA